MNKFLSQFTSEALRLRLESIPKLAIGLTTASVLVDPTLNVTRKHFGTVSGFNHTTQLFSATFPTAQQTIYLTMQQLHNSISTPSLQPNLTLSAQASILLGDTSLRYTM